MVRVLASNDILIKRNTAHTSLYYSTMRITARKIRIDIRMTAKCYALLRSQNARLQKVKKQEPFLTIYIMERALPLKQTEQHRFVLPIVLSLSALILKNFSGKSLDQSTCCLARTTQNRWNRSIIDRILTTGECNTYRI